MAGSGNYIHKSIDQMESIWQGSYVRARGELETTAFGLGVLRLPPNFDRAPTHNHRFDGQEEVYLPIAGSGAIVCGGEPIELSTNSAIRVGPTVSRTFTSGPEGVVMLIAGGTPGKAYEAFAPLELGAPEPNTRELPGIKAEEGHVSTDDFNVKTFDQAGPISGALEGVTFIPLGRALGTRAFGIAAVELAGGEKGDDYPRHSHEEDNQVEVFVITEGSGTMEIEDEAIAVGQGEMIAVKPEAARTVKGGPQGLKMVVIGAPEGAPYSNSQPTMK